MRQQALACWWACSVHGQRPLKILHSALEKQSEKVSLSCIEWKQVVLLNPDLPASRCTTLNTPKEVPSCDPFLGPLMQSSHLKAMKRIVMNCQHHLGITLHTQLYYQVTRRLLGAVSLIRMNGTVSCQ